jgi:membrane protein implicated in regulation of membrane protease activity
MNYNVNLLFIILGFIMIGIEILLGAVTGFELLILGLILIVSGSLGYVANSFVLAIFTATVLLFVYVFFGRQKLRDYLVLGTKKTNVDSLIGKEAAVIEDISSTNAGKVKIDGEVWRASCGETVKKGSTVKIESVSGVTLSVTPEL